MKVVHSIDEMRSISSATSHMARSIGLVPTMGCLHEGHMSLVHIAAQRSDLVVVSIFVNPTQFGEGEDLEAYPRDLKGDLISCETGHVDVVFAPSVEEMYAGTHSVYVEEVSLSGGLCGESRPHHFKGVITVVAKLFNIVRPDIAVFGQKDAQQVRVIQRMVRDLNFQVDIIKGRIVREEDGLAMSSRNAYLSTDQRQQALGIYESLCAARDAYEGGMRGVSDIRELIQKVIGTRSMVSIEYVELVDDETLDRVDRVDKPTLIAVAATVGKTRLIDNVVLG